MEIIKNYDDGNIRSDGYGKIALREIEVFFSFGVGFITHFRYLFLQFA